VAFPQVWEVVLVGRSLDLGVAVLKGRCECRLEVTAAVVQLGSAEQAWPPAEGAPAQEATGLQPLSGRL
jgi:hypothetical protein